MNKIDQKIQGGEMQVVMARLLRLLSNTGAGRVTDSVDKTDHLYANRVPFVSFIIPTFNARQYLERCLTSIFAQTYPHDRFEVLVADGGSTDDTRDIIARYPVTLIENERVIAEYGKYQAYQQARGDYLVLLDADNIIASSDWLMRLIEPLESDRSMLAAESNYLMAPDFTSINRYANLLVIVDPLARMLATTPRTTSDPRGWIRKEFASGSTPVAGANGFIWRRSVVDTYLDTTRSTLEETNLLNTVCAHEPVRIANVPGVGIYHYYCSSFSEYMRKREKIARKFLERKHHGQPTWVDQHPIRLPLATLFLASMIGPLIEALGQFMRSGNKAWFWHPIVSVASMYIYMRALILSALATR